MKVSESLHLSMYLFNTGLNEGVDGKLLSMWFTLFPVEIETADNMGRRFGTEGLDFMINQLRRDLHSLGGRDFLAALSVAPATRITVEFALRNDGWKGAMRELEAFARSLVDADHVARALGGRR